MADLQLEFYAVLGAALLAAILLWPLSALAWLIWRAP